MLNRQFLAGMLLAAALCAGCSRAPAPETAGSSVSPRPGEPTQAQPRLRTVKLWLGPTELVAEVASTASQITTGMMFRQAIGENEGMLFVFGTPHRTSFWMKNTSVPLSAAYIDPEGVILEVHELEPHNTNSVVAGSSRVQYVLETSRGWFQRHGVKEGMVVRTEFGSLRDTFVSRRRE